MSRPAVAALCALVLLAGFVVGRVTGSGAGRSTTVHDAVTRTVVVSAEHVGSARDGRDSGPLDLVQVRSRRRKAVLETTIVARRPWSDELIASGRVRIAILYDSDHDGAVNRRDVLYVQRGGLRGWITTYRQGAQDAVVTRDGPAAVTVARDVSILYNAPGQAPLLMTSPIGVAVVASWPGGRDRVPDRGWITVPPPT